MSTTNVIISIVILAAIAAGGAYTSGYLGETAPTEEASEGTNAN